MRSRSLGEVSKKVVLMMILLICTVSFIGCGRNSEDNLKITEADNGIIREYIDNKTGNKIVVNEGHVYSAFKVLGTDKNEIYLWVLKENSVGSGGSMPVLLKASRVNGELSITDFKIPRDGEEYVEDIKEMFPRYVRKQIYADVNTYNAMIYELQEQINELKKKG
ncbi:hypothetical protein [Clostridium sp. LIBA-8841]|uniref:hypothetical protein n=1 Tax=Clostridium sp. LIBA-8841 TaxID=2987530 RepID=UPI002AC75289|nr:hypothetical protein [Clostridium sp. LIBA-8841]MDZ5253619.1 hypothetical protein [Clostridium sp. LIBA-8841]